MRLTHYNTPYHSLGNNLENWLRGSSSSFPALSRFFDGTPLSGNKTSGHLATDIHEDKDHYYAVFEAPGVKKEDLKIELHDRLLTVSFERKYRENEEASRYTSSRSISVPDSVKPDGIAAKLEDGILTITLPKSEEKKPRVIHIA
ncbi:N/A [soil metagenome]